MDSATLKKMQDGLKRVAKAHGPDMVFDGTVLEVDAENYVCDVELDTGETIYQVRLRAIAAGSKSIDVLPRQNTAVVIAKITEDDYLLLAADEVDDIRLQSYDFTVQLNASGISITNGTESLKDILTGFVTQMMAIYAPKDVAGIEALQLKINALLC